VVAADVSPAAPPCRGADPLAVAACVDASRYAADVAWIAQPRPPGSLHHVRVQALCAETFERHGYEVEVDRYATGANVFGIRPGRRPQRVMFGAHYDHIPGCDGADDNATGLAAVLELSRVFASLPSEATLVFACWDEEERGLVGSRDWARRARAAGLPVELYVNFDAIGYRDDRPNAQRVPAGFGLLFGEQVAQLQAHEMRADFIALVADPRAAPFARRISAFAETLALPAAVLEIPQLLMDSHLAVDLQRSDHAALWDIEVPAVMITDTADFRSPAYHCRDAPDDVRSLDLEFANLVVQATAAAASEYLAAPRDPQ
jgi:Zn-dependent M28 family amino/carboxypeptidase